MERLLGITWLKHHPNAADVLLAAFVSAVSLSIHLIGTGLDEIYEISEPSWWTVLLVLAATVPLVWRRRRPITAAAVIVVVLCLLEVLRIEGTGWISLVVAIYSLGAHSDHRRRSLVVFGLFVLIAALLVSGLIAEEIGVATIIGSAAIVVTAFVFGDNVRQRRRNLEILAERTERLERERELLARDRVRDERGRIARELHDVVAHSVSVMIIQAGAARRSLPDRPGDAEEMLGEVERTGRRAMDELRRVLGVLRTVDEGSPDGDAPNGDAMLRRDPQPGIAEIHTLVADDPGLPVHLHIDDGVEGLPEGLAVSVYRLVQESLTNIRRHAGPVTRIDVELRLDDGALDVSVADDGRGAASDDAGDQGGFGIIGMQERMHALGGTVTAGPRRGGGWRVHARIPVQLPTATGRR